MNRTEKAKKMVVVMDSIQEMYDHLEVAVNQLSKLDKMMEPDIKETEERIRGELDYLAQLAGCNCRNMIRELAGVGKAVSEAEKILEHKRVEESGSPS